MSKKKKTKRNTRLCQNQPRRLLIVDGYNVLRSGSRYQNITAPFPDYADDYYNQAREMLINDVASFAGNDYRATVVFDAAGNEFSTGSQESVGGIRVVFSPAGRSADEIIEKLAHEARNNDLEVLVVSSDASIQETVFSGRVTRMSANDFSYNMNSYDASGENVAQVIQYSIQSATCSRVRKRAGKKVAGASNVLREASGRGVNNTTGNSARTTYIANPSTAHTAPKNTLAERISPDQLEKLKRLRDGDL